MLQTFDLTNEQQLWIMEKVKRKEMTVEGAQSMATMMTKKKLQESTMDFDSSKAFTFGVIRYPFGFSEGNGIKNSMQIDFRKQSIYFMDKITIHIIIPFSDIVLFTSIEDSYSIKLVTKHSKFKFSTNKENKSKIERLFSTIILQNECETNVPSSPTDDITALDIQPDGGPKSTILTIINRHTVLKEGLLEKKGNAAIVRWSTRFLRVQEREFSYYDPNNLKEPLGVVQINASTEIDAIKSEKDTFVITVGKRSYYFRVKKYETPERTQGERDAWIIAFRDACSKETLMKYWIKNRKSILPQYDQHASRGPSPPVDYDYNDGRSLSYNQEYLEMETFGNSSFINTSALQPTQLKHVEKDISVNITTDGPSPKPIRIAPNPPMPAALREYRSVPPPPPPPPPPQGMTRKSTGSLKVHCETKLKHYFVPIITPKEMKKSVWSVLTDVSPRLDLSLLKKHFKEDRHPTIVETEKKRQTVLDSKKAQNILILMKANLFLQTVHNLKEKINTIKPPNEEEIEIIQKIQKYQPTNDEIEIYTNMKNEKTKLTGADKTMSEMSEIPLLQKRLELSLNLWTYESQYKEFAESLDLLSAACNEILNSKKFEKVLEYLLAVLNLMNTSGTSQSGHVMNAFHLKFLSQLKNIQNKDGFTLMKMLVTQLQRTDPDLLDFHKELNTIKQCENMSIKAIHASMEVLKQDLISIKTKSIEIQKELVNLTLSEKEFFENTKTFYKTQQQQLVSTETLIGHINKNYADILVWFGLPKDTSSEEVFEYLTTFLREFADNL